MVAKIAAPLLVIVGETASGKSSLAMKLARELNGEIISADSWTVYRDFNIGTAKPTQSERASVRHHIIDVTEARDGFNAVRFQELAKRSIEEIHSRHKLPILAGGTGLYVDSVIYDYEFLPPTEPKLRETLNRLDLDELLKLARQEALDLEKVDVRNKRRIVRLIENKGALPGRQPLRKNTVIIGLNSPREALQDKIIGRVEDMLDAGLEAEVRQLAAEYGWNVEPMKGIGYKEWRAYIEGTQSMEMTKQLIIKNSLSLAKRQRTWFKRNKSIHWINNRDDLPAIVDFVTTHLHKV